MIIYKATNIINGKVYIGYSTRELNKRKLEHIRDAFCYESNLIFHKALRRYGEDSFTWEIIDTATNETKLKEKEMYWIKHYNSLVYDNNSNGYNMTIGGDGALGNKLTEEQKDKFRGSKQGHSKLSEDDVLHIKSLIKQGLRLSEISDIFNVNETTISKIKMGVNWSHIGENVSNINSRKIHGIILDAIMVKEIKNMLASGARQKEIARNYGVSKETINAIKRGAIWRDVGLDPTKLNNPKITDEQVLEVKELLLRGDVAIMNIAKMYNVSRSVIYRIKNSIK